MTSRRQIGTKIAKITDEEKWISGEYLESRLQRRNTTL
jgi:hypothetical protein